MTNPSYLYNYPDNMPLSVLLLLNPKHYIHRLDLSVDKNNIGTIIRFECHEPYSVTMVARLRIYIYVPVQTKYVNFVMEFGHNL